MQNMLQIVADVCQIVSTLWMLIFGGKAFWEIKIKVGVKQSTVTNLLLAAILFVLVSFRANLIPVPWHSSPGQAVAPGKATVTPLQTPTLTPSSVGNIAKGNELYQQIILGRPPSHPNNLDAQSDDPWGMSSYAGQQYGCVFRNGAYVAYENHLNYVQPCFANSFGSLKNFAYEVTMTVTGSGGGLIFRAAATTTGLPSYNSAMYRLSVRPADGSFNLVVQTSNAGNTNRPCDTDGDRSCQSAWIHQQGSNTLAVIAQGNTLYYYINSHCVAQITDTTQSSGFIGVYAVDAGSETSAAFSSAKIWYL